MLPEVNALSQGGAWLLWAWCLSCVLTYSLGEIILPVGFLQRRVRLWKADSLVPSIDVVLGK